MHGATHNFCCRPDGLDCARMRSSNKQRRPLFHETHNQTMPETPVQLGISGFGRIGRLVARSAFETEVRMADDGTSLSLTPVLGAPCLIRPLPGTALWHIATDALASVDATSAPFETSESIRNRSEVDPTHVRVMGCACAWHGRLWHTCVHNF